MKKVLVTGSSGLIGSEVCKFFAHKSYIVHGIDNNSRATFFGPEGDTRWNQSRLQKSLSNFTHHECDIRSRVDVFDIFDKIKPNLIVHAAAQPSHDKASSIPFDDFETNAVGTLNLLESSRKYTLESPFIFLSSNKVYGDKPNSIKIKELPTRWDFDDINYQSGISENFSIDQSKHSLFGASKLSADIMVQEYGRYFGMPTCCLRGGCLTGPNHTGVELHGFLSYLIKCNMIQKNYTINGYKGKQVRDNIHSFDVANFIWHFSESPRVAEVYNIGGGRENSCSILESFTITEDITGKKMSYSLNDEHRIGDHICYYSDLTKIKSHYPKWQITKDLFTIFKETYESWISRC